LADTLGLSKSQIDKYNTIALLSKRTATELMNRKLPFDWMNEISRVIKVTKNEELREDLENAIIEKIDNKTVMTIREVRKYREAVQVGGEPIVQNIIKNKRYTPTEAAKDAGTGYRAAMMNLTWGSSAFINQGAFLLGQKHVVLTDSLHHRLVQAKRVLDKLVDLDFAPYERKSKKID